jgi:predicted metal-dependent hydrolase
MRNLWHDGALFKLSTWRSAWRFLFGKDGIISANRQAWRDYLAADFHPDQHDASLSRQWLADNAGQFAVVG